VLRPLPLALLDDLLAGEVESEYFSSFQTSFQNYPKTTFLPKFFVR
jgi:hypothetical protein